MGKLVEFPSYIYEKEKRLEKKANDLFELEQELSYKSFATEVEESRLNSRTSGQKSRMISAFLFGFVMGILTFSFITILYS